jgi:hypothetical protein
MLSSLLLAATLSLVPAGAPCTAPAADTTRALYESGRTFPAFLASVRARKAAWDGNYAKGASLDSALVARARAAAGPWRLLVVAVDGCSDSANTIPWIARLVEQVPGLELRVVLPGPGGPVMASHRTPDDRAATPTVVLLDADWREIGCFIERPRPIRDWMLAEKAKVGADSAAAHKAAWYVTDAGRSTLVQVVEMLEAARRGTPQCE